MASNGNSAGSVLIGFALGAITGAAVALLFAPASGEETRKKLAEKAREGRDRAEAFARDGRDYVRSQRENIVSTVERGREAFEQARKESL